MRRRALFTLVLATAVGCGSPSDFFGEEATASMGTGATSPATQSAGQDDDGDGDDGDDGETTGGADPDDSADPEGSATTSGDDGANAESGSTGAPWGDSTDDGMGDGGSDGSGSTGGEGAAGFGECVDADEATCNLQPQCIWQGGFDDVGFDGTCAADPAHCGELDELGCGDLVGCAWTDIPFPDLPELSGSCAVSCQDVDEQTCGALPTCNWFEGGGKDSPFGGGDPGCFG